MNLLGIFLLLELIDFLMGLVNQPQIVLAPFFYCINTPVGSQSHEPCHQSYLLMCIFPQMPNRVLVKQILHLLHP